MRKLSISHWPSVSTEQISPICDLFIRPPFFASVALPPLREVLQNKSSRAGLIHREKPLHTNLSNSAPFAPPPPLLIKIFPKNSAGEFQNGASSSKPLA